MKVIALLLAASLISLSASAALLTITYTSTARALLEQFREIAKARGLDAVQVSSAERLATSWFYMLPCRGSSKHIDFGSVLQSIGYLKSTRAEDAAVLEMIASLLLMDQGRPTQDSHVCRFALEMAVPLVPDGR